MKGREKVERLALVVTGENTEKVLGIPKLDDGTGEKIAQTIHDFLGTWKMDDLVEFVCFDTTSTNTGIHKGAAYLLEKKLDRDLLFLPCRHHISELLLKAVFELNFGKSSAPDVLMFDRFARKWNGINTKNFKNGMVDEKVRNSMGLDEIELHKEFCLTKLRFYHERMDYKELLELSLIFIGGNVPNFKQFRLPGATSHARFMAKAIYIYKMFLFRDEFKMTSKELDGIRNVCIFLTRVYVRFWFNCTNATEAPRRDLQIIKDSIEYSDKRVSGALLEKLRNHLWYLSEEAAGLAFFDSGVLLETKRKMVQALGNVDIGDEELASPKRLNSTVEEMITFADKDLSHFVTYKTKRFFLRLEIGMDFLQVDPSEWSARDDYLTGLRICQNLSVVNDAAERAVKLITDFNRALTYDENDKQYLIQVVEHYRQIYPSHTKSSLLSRNYS